MTTSEFKSIKSIFYQFTGEFRVNDKLHPMMALKLEHSGRVAALCEEIALKAQLDQGSARLACLCGLYHDIGRFPQYKKYSTFYDAASVNHGELGADTASEVLYGKCSKEILYIITEVIRSHNSRFIDKHKGAPYENFLKMVRDSDKIDIYHVIHSAVSAGSLGDYPEIIWHIDINGALNGELVKDLENKVSADYKKVKSLKDFIFLQLSWVYDINFKRSYEIINERNIISNIAAILKDFPEAFKAIDTAREHIACMVSS